MIYEEDCWEIFLHGIFKMRIFVQWNLNEKDNIRGWGFDCKLSLFKREHFFKYSVLSICLISRDNGEPQTFGKEQQIQENLSLLRLESFHSPPFLAFSSFQKNMLISLFKWSLKKSTMKAAVSKQRKSSSEMMMAGLPQLFCKVILGDILLVKFRHPRSLFDAGRKSSALRMNLRKGSFKHTF